MLELTTLAQNAYASSDTIDDSVMIVIGMSLMAFLFFMVLAIALPIHAKVKTRQELERTKREIAAYVAEGSISPEEGTKMIKAAELGGAKG